MQNIFRLLIFILSALTATESPAQIKTVYDQLVYVNAEWKNQPDVDQRLKKQPAKHLSEQQLIQLHLTETEKLLRSRNVSTLSSSLRRQRLKNLDVLHGYLSQGSFPVNSLHINRQPYFIDDNNTYCAVGYLMKESGADDVAKEIKRTQNYNYLNDISHPKLMDWVKQSGLSFSELALIQPGYPGDWPSAIMEFHYNNTGTDVNEYIEVHQSTGGPQGMAPFSTILFYDVAGTLYKTLLITQMQSYTSGTSTVYYYTFPANEGFADKGKIELKGIDFSSTLKTLSTTTYTDVSVITQDHYLNTVRQFSTGESETTPVNTTLTYCGFYMDNNWSLQSIASTVGTQNPCTIMPVGLTSFSYSIANKKVDLFWETLSEANNKMFEIERSMNGIEFTSIGKVAGSNTSTTLKQYSFTDKTPNYTNHYRLKQVDLDGKYSYSKILYVKVAQVSPLSILQTVVKTNLLYQVSSSNAAQVKVYNLTGAQVFNSTTKMGINSVNVSAWAAGKYLLRLYSQDGQVYTQSFIKN